MKEGGDGPSDSRTGFPAAAKWHQRDARGSFCSHTTANGGECLQRQEQAWGLITRHRIPESLNGDDLVDLLLVPPSWTQPARVSPRSLHFPRESRNFHEMPGLVMRNLEALCLQVLPEQQSELENIIDLQEREMICDWSGKSMSHKSFQSQCPLQMTHGLALTAQNEEDPSSGCVPEDFRVQGWPATQWYEECLWVHWFIGVSYLHKYSRLGWRRVDERVLDEKDGFEVLVMDFRPSP